MAYKYNPHKLPRVIDFHKATKEFPISREAKTKLQVALSKMTKDQIKKSIKSLHDMQYESLEGLKRVDWERIEKHLTNPLQLKKLKPELQDDFRMAIWCKYCEDFAQKYLYSLEKQKKI